MVSSSTVLHFSFGKLAQPGRCSICVPVRGVQSSDVAAAAIALVAAVRSYAAGGE